MKEKERKLGRVDNEEERKKEPTEKGAKRREKNVKEIGRI